MTVPRNGFQPGITPRWNMEQPINYEAGIKSGSMIFLLGIQDCTAGRSLPGTQMIF
jgi:hypothetical protein